MLAHTYFNNICINTYKKENFLTFMLEYGVYITRPLSKVRVEEEAKVQY